MASTVEMVKTTENGVLTAIVAKGHIGAHLNEGWHYKNVSDLIAYGEFGGSTKVLLARDLLDEPADALPVERRVTINDAITTDTLGNTVEVNEIGAMQAIVEGRFDLIDYHADRVLAEVLAYGAKKYAEENWRGIPARSHLNHCLRHLRMALHEARTGENPEPGEDHLGHALCRLHMAVAIREQGGPSKEAM